MFKRFVSALETCASGEMVSQFMALRTGNGISPKHVSLYVLKNLLA
jgi:hypothetical protein